MRIVTLDVEGVEQADKAFDVLVLLEELLEDRTIYHVVDYADIEMFSLRLEGRVVFYRLFHILLNEF